MKRVIKILLIAIGLVMTHSSASYAQHYYTVKEALAYLFPDSKTVTFEKKVLAPAQVQTLQTALKSRDVKTDWTIYVAKSGERADGYAIVDNVLGKEKPITFVVSISPQGSVKEVEILEYRESHGGQVKNQAYRKQFVGKTAADPVQVGRDIRNVSGATISSRNVAFGVRRALAVWNTLYH